MNNLIQIYSSIKKEQKPIMQFLELEKSSFILNNLKRYANKQISLLIILSFFFSLTHLFGFSFLFFLTFSFVSFLLWQNIKSISFIFRYSKIYYEESSWFDVKIWQKPIFLIKNDKLFFHLKSKEQIQFFYKFIIQSIFFLLLEEVCF